MTIIKDIKYSWKKKVDISVNFTCMRLNYASPYVRSNQLVRTITGPEQNLTGPEKNYWQYRTAGLYSVKFCPNSKWTEKKINPGYPSIFNILLSKYYLFYKSTNYWRTG